MTSRRLLTLSGAAAALALALAHAAEHLAGLRPCPLCLLQRWPYWLAIGVTAVGLLAPARFGGIAVVAAAALFLGNAGLAAFHAGVEWGLWPSAVPACAPPGLGTARTVEELLLSLPPVAAVPCDEPALRVLGLSMAGWNALYALAVAALLTMSLLRRGREG
ncbi:MAG: disulfide bond formation protein B [Acetobacteraceae bacterium]|nr:disulfide bond formation protein B [Acetobacteraceae bacterium]